MSETKGVHGNGAHEPAGLLDALSALGLVEAPAPLRCVEGDAVRLLGIGAGQYLAVYCRGADVQLKCTSKESVKYECFYGSAPGVNSSSTLSTWSGRMGWRAALEVGGAAASASGGSGECPALCASVRVSASVCLFVCVCV